jgi:2'-hydroxyisoflavone reductase
MRILILGGTAFLSAATARLALQRGHQVSCLARGTTNEPPDGAEWIRADRDDPEAAYAQAAAVDWDAVIDVAMQPIQVRQALAALADRAKHWTFVSTISVYSDDSQPGQDESALLHQSFDGDRFTEMADYGPAKVTCEQLVLDALPGQSHIVRAGLICGPGDRSDRVGYWPARFARRADDPADRVLVPDALTAQTQLIDVDDLAGWLLDAAEGGVAGAYNATGDPVTLGEVLDTAARVAGHHGRMVRVDPAFLVDHGVGYWAGPDSLPLWVPGEDRGFGNRSTSAAKRAGMLLRPLDNTLARVLAYERTAGLDRDRRAGLDPATENRVLDAWQSTGGA